MPNILLVEPPKSKAYYTRYPPLGLLKLATFHKQQGDKVQLIRGLSDAQFRPDIIYITSLFTYAYQAVHDAIRYYTAKYTKADIIVGGIYATLCADHLRMEFGDRVDIKQGILWDVEELLPDYSIVPEFDASLIFSTRGCINSCPYCAVSQLEPQFLAKKSIKHLISPSHKKVVLWDNNILASPFWHDIYSELRELRCSIDFNQGLDARLITEQVASQLSVLNVPLFDLPMTHML